MRRQGSEPEPQPQISLAAIPSIELDTVHAALTDSPYDFRTIETVSAETGLDREHVAVILEKSGIARSPLFRQENGERLYTPAERPKTLSERVRSISWFMRHYVARET